MGTKREKHTLSTPPGLWQQWEGFAAERGLSVAEYLRRAEEAFRAADAPICSEKEAAALMEAAIADLSERGGDG